MSALVYVDERHEYSVDGVRWPSVTECLARAGLTSFDHIPLPYRRAALARGRRVHRAAQLLAEGRLDWSSLDPVDRPFVESCAQFLEAGGVTFDFLERRLHHPGRRYAGTCDAGGWWQGAYTLVDWCCGDLWESAKDLQTAAYAEALRAHPPIEWPDFDPKKTPIARLGVRLMKSGAMAKPEPYRDPHDFTRFLMALAVTWEQERRGIHRSPIV